MALEQQSVSSLSIISSFLNKGFIAASLTDFTTSAQSLIAAGSCVEVGGTCFYTSGNVSISGFSSITTATSCYLYLTPSGTAPSMILDASWNATSPVWVGSKNGWYASAGSITRVIGGAYKTSATQQDLKWIFDRDSGIQNIIRRGDGTTLINSLVAPTLQCTTLSASSTIHSGGAIHGNNDTWALSTTRNTAITGSSSASGAIYTIPAGAYYIWARNLTSPVYLQIHDGTNWYNMGGTNNYDYGFGTVVISDGTNYILYANGGTSFWTLIKMG